MAIITKSYFERFLEILLVILISVVVLLVLIQVFSRYLVQLPFVGIEELARLAFVWACFLGTSLGIIQNRHISIDIILKKFSPRSKRYAWLLAQLMILMVTAVMVVYGTQFSISKWAYPDYSTALFYPRSLFYIPVPISGAIMFFYTVKNIIKRELLTQPVTEKES